MVVRTVETCIEIRELAFQYPDGRTALNGLNLSLCPGEKVALVGPNGAGKSTLLLHLNGILKASVGAVHIFGQDMTKDNLPQIRAQVGLVFQDPDDQLFSPTVFDDVAYGPLYAGLSEVEIRERVQWALEQVGMEEYADRYSHHLSAGEKKRAAIATVLAMHPAILALDEPTAGLDPRARRRLIELLRNLKESLVAATHDLGFVAEVFGRTVVLDGGQVVADGPTEVILGDDDLLEAHGLR